MLGTVLSTYTDKPLNLQFCEKQVKSAQSIEIGINIH